MHPKLLLLFFICFFVSSTLADTQLIEPIGIYKTIDITEAKDATHTLANGTSEDKQKVISDVINSSEKYSPPVLYAVSNEFAKNNQLDEALFWFYAAQLRASGDAKLSADPSSASGVMLLNSSMNANTRKHQFTVVDKLEGIVDSAISWDIKTLRKYDTRWISVYGSKAMRHARFGEPAPTDLSIPAADWESTLTKAREEWHQGFIKALPMIKNAASKKQY
jgi:hypothetical protein